MLLLLLGLLGAVENSKILFSFSDLLLQEPCVEGREKPPWETVCGVDNKALYPQASIKGLFLSTVSDVKIAFMHTFSLLPPKSQDKTGINRGTKLQVLELTRISQNSSAVDNDARAKFLFGLLRPSLWVSSLAGDHFSPVNKAKKRR